MSLLELIDRSNREGAGEVPDASDRLAHRTRLFEQMAFLGCVTLALLSVFHFTMEMYALAVLQFPILFINIMNLVSQRYHRRLELAMNIMLGSGFIALLPLLVLNLLFSSSSIVKCSFISSTVSNLNPSSLATCLNASVDTG